MTLGHSVAVMLSGVLQQVGSPVELYNNPTNLFEGGVHRLAQHELDADDDR